MVEVGEAAVRAGVCGDEACYKEGAEGVCFALVYLPNVWLELTYTSS